MRMATIFVLIIRITKWTLAVIWLLLTAIVAMALFDRWSHPGWKSISNRDLYNYGLITIIIFAIYFGATYAIKQKDRQRKKSINRQMIH